MKSILKSLYHNSRNEGIKKLIFDVFNDDYIVRGNIAIKPNNPISVLERLSEDKHKAVRALVASNPDTPIFILEKLSNDENLMVRKSTTRNLNLIKYTNI